MAGDLQQDVLINLKLVADKSNRQVAQQVRRQVEETTKKIDGITKKSIDQEAKSRERAMRERSKALERAAREEEKAAREEERRQERVFKNRARLLDRIAKEEEKQRRDKLRGEEQLAKKLDSLDAKRFEALKAGQTAARGAAQGLLDVVEASAILGISGKENLEEFVRSFAKITAAFRGLRGGLDIIFEGAEALRQFRTAADALAASRLLSGGAQAAGSAGRAGTALNAVGALGALPILKAAGAKALAAAGAAGTGALALGGGIVGAEIIGRIGTGEGVLSSVGGFFDAKSGLRASNKAVARAQSRRDQLLQQKLLIQEQATQEAAGRQTQRGLVGSLAGLTGGGLAGLEATRRFDIQEVGAAGQAVAGAKPLEQEAALQRLVQAHQNLFETEQRRLGVARSIADTRKAEVESAKQTLESAREQVRLAKEQQQSRLGQFGLLDAASQQAAKQLADKVKSGGQLGRADILTAQRLGLGDAQAVKSGAAQLGKAAGGEDILAALGLNKDLETAQQKAAKAAQELEKSELKEVQAKERLTSAAQDAAKALREVQQAVARLNERSGTGAGPVNLGELAGAIREAAARSDDEAAAERHSFLRAVDEITSGRTRDISEIREGMERSLQLQKANSR